jgi:hypothetical protein
VVGAAVHDAVADRHLVSPSWRPATPASRDRGRQVGTPSAVEGPVDRTGAPPHPGLQAGPHADAVDLAADAARRRRCLDREELELEARGAGVDDEDRVHAQTAGDRRISRRAAA